MERFSGMYIHKVFVPYFKDQTFGTFGEVLE